MHFRDNAFQRFCISVTLTTGIMHFRDFVCQRLCISGTLHFRDFACQSLCISGTLHFRDFTFQGLCISGTICISGTLHSMAMISHGDIFINGVAINRRPSCYDGNSVVSLEVTGADEDKCGFWEGRNIYEHWSQQMTHRTDEGPALIELILLIERLQVSRITLITAFGLNRMNWQQDRSIKRSNLNADTKITFKIIVLICIII